MSPAKQNGKQALSPSEKLKAIHMVLAGQSKASVARELQIPESTLRGWCKNASKIESQVTGRPPKSKSPEEHVFAPAKRRRKSDEPFNLSMKASDVSTSFSSSESEYSQAFQDESNHNKAELARLSVQLGLNQPEVSVYPPPASYPANTPMRAHTTNRTGQQPDLLSAVDDNNIFSKLLLNQTMFPVCSPYPMTYYPEASKPINTSAAVENDGEQLKESATGFNTLPYHQRHYAQMLLNAMLMEKNCERVPTRGSDSASNTSGAEPLKANYRNRSVLSEVQPVQRLSSNAPTPEESPGTDLIKLMMTGDAMPRVNGKHKASVIQQIVDVGNNDSVNSEATPKNEKSMLQQQININRKRPISDEEVVNDNRQEASESNSSGATSVDMPKSTSKNRSVLSVVNNLCPENQNLSIETTPKENVQEPFRLEEAIRHGEKFLEYLKPCTDPSVSSSQLKQVTLLLNKLKEIFEKQNSTSLNLNRMKRK